MCEICDAQDRNDVREPHPAEAREVLADFMLQGHLTYRDGMARGSDYDRADAMIRDLLAEGLTITPTPPLPDPAGLLAAPYVHEFDGVTTLDTILMDWGFREGEREDFASWLIETISHQHHPATARADKSNAAED